MESSKRLRLLLARVEYSEVDSLSQFFAFSLVTKMLEELLELLVFCANSVTVRLGSESSIAKDLFSFLFLVLSISNLEVVVVISTKQLLVHSAEVYE